ncbi:hypothetical protein ACFVWX_24640 [Streptomyces sp. NPDC058220]|uniref:hypothetical protein n=1 Tax=unclassified Streptomyces TaxID=2593676 RepID=UPI00366788A1
MTSRLTSLIATAATGAILLVGGAAATSAAAAEPTTTASAAEAAPLLVWQKYGNFPLSQCVNWGTLLVNNGQAAAWQCVSIGSGIHELWVLR